MMKQQEVMSNSEHLDDSIGSILTRYSNEIEGWAGENETYGVGARDSHKLLNKNSDLTL